MTEGILTRIRRAVPERQDQVTDHALEEADADNLTPDDILNVPVTGDLDSVYEDDPRGTRYVVRGEIDVNGSTWFAASAAMARC